MKILSKSAVLAVLAASLSACAFNPPSLARAPLSPELEAKVAENRDYPRWQDFPADPVNVPGASYVRSAVTALEGDQQTLDTQVAAIDWELGDAEEYVAAIQQRIAADDVEIPTANTPAEIEAFAASLRERAKAPPPIDRPMR